LKPNLETTNLHFF